MGIWSEPPGGFTPRQVRMRRRRRLQASVAGLVALTLGLGAGRAHLLRSEPVSHAEALSAYRIAVVPDETEAEPRQDQAQPREEESSRSRREVAPRERNLRETARRTPRARSGEGDPTDSSAPQRRRKLDPVRPPDGVYTWDVEGYEQTSGGMRRELPARSHRVVTHGEGRSWVEHHIFSDKREEWFEMDHPGSDFTLKAVRNRVEFSPVEVDRTVTFQPPVLVGRLPMRVGDAWSGSWDGSTEGEYRARVFERTELTIEGTRVEVWGTEVIMRMRGEVEGDVVTRSWFAPDRALIVKQYQRMSVKTGPGGYQTEWTGRVASIDPKR